ncbi:Nucleoid-associated protein YgaU, contains BON and LysM domains [Paraburkholderia steynii]|uniref:Nucleoid-associated protein YgaU, contains BON and LysM domains n=1 Tax=Paraburkholderia steynii TaxID=1245441 RepID=A0A7Z7BH00_9BURK|nr:peptidoglycan-binding protein [Paraburkholderia steynii]SDJ22207.1 Nucleoid-associated protein YgaU, contains BON and LysM domains [Paraburkholderia steynii]
MGQPPLTKATITVLEGAHKGKIITVLFNPTEYSFDRSNSFKATSVPGLGAPLLQFVNGESAQLSMDLFLDDYTDPRGPTSLQQKEDAPLRKRLEDLTSLLDIDRDLHAPPSVLFNWGTMLFTAVIERIGRKVTMFHPDGAPARVTLSVTFKEYRTLRNLVEDPRRESSDKTKRRVVVGRESLWLIAAREYDDAGQWVCIAQANDLDDPREIRAGDWLELPPLEISNETGRTL